MQPLSIAQSPFGSRRRTLRILGCALASLASLPLRAQTLLRPTPAQTEGPFYPTKLPADRDADLTEVAGYPQPAQGIRLYFSGRVLIRDGSAQRSAVVELWQCDVFGRYHHAGDEGSPRDEGFQGYGVTTTDGEGRFAFKTIRPVAYSGRVPHLHLKVRTAAGGTLTTQVYIAGDRTAGDPVLAFTSAEGRQRLTMVVAPVPGREAGALAGAFDIVMP